MSEEKIVDWRGRTYRVRADGSVAVWREAASGVGAVDFEGHWRELKRDGRIARKVRAEGLTEDEQRASRE